MDKRLSQIVGANLKRAIALSDFKTQEIFAFDYPRRFGACKLLRLAE